MAVNQDSMPSKKRRSTFGGLLRWSARADFLVSVVLAFYVLLLLNIISFRRPNYRIDLTREGVYTLSQSTRDRLALIEEEVWVVIPTFLQADNPDHLVRREVLSRARFLLNEFVAVQPLIRIAEEVDVFADPQRWLKVREAYDLSAGQVNRLLFFAGLDHEYVQTVTPEDMASFAPARDPVMTLPEIRDFRAEKAMIDALTRLVERRTRVLYFTQGHEELQLPSEKSASQVSGGLSALVSELKAYGIESRSIRLADAGSEGGVPADCEVLVIPGPFLRFSPREVEAVRNYLNRGGRLLVTLTPARTGLEEVLKEWGVEAPSGTIRGFFVSTGKRLASDEIPVQRFSAEHPITAVFANVRTFDVRMLAARALRAVGLENGRKSIPLLETGEATNTQAFYLVEPGQGVAGVKPQNHAVAIAVEQLVPERPPPGFQRIDTRLVVFGASGLLADESFGTGSHRDIILNSVSWLLGEERRITTPGEAWSRVVLPADQKTRKFLLWVPIALLPSLVLAVGAFVYFLRRA